MPAQGLPAPARSKAEAWAELEGSTFFSHSSVWLQTDSIAAELCISMYNYLLISWRAHHAKKVSGYKAKTFLLSLSFRPEK